MLVPNWPLRQGATRLFAELRARSCEVWIYTTSFREPRSISRWLWAYDCGVDGVVNQQRHDHEHRNHPKGSVPTKNPATFGIQLHVDDSDGVLVEGTKHGFSVVVVSQDDTGWVETILSRVDQMLKANDGGAA